MAIAISDEHQEFQRTVRSLLERRGAKDCTRVAVQTGLVSRPSYWDESSQLGWLGLHLSEDVGGSGFELFESALLLEELGYALANGPYLPTIAAGAVLTRSNADGVQKILASLSDGGTIAAVGLQGSLAIREDGSLHGDGGIVLGASEAEWLLLRCGEDIVVVGAEIDGLTVETPTNLDPSRPASIVRADNVASAAFLTISGAAVDAMACMRTLAAAEAIGGARACLDQAVEYAKTRFQFGRPIGSFQAIKHHCADMLVRTELGASAVWDAARAASETPDQFYLAAAVATAVAMPAYLRNAEVSIQVHGGIGYTWEHDAHLYLRRAATLSALHSPRSAACDVTRQQIEGIRRDLRVTLPPSAEPIRAAVREVADRLRLLGPGEQMAGMIESGFAQPHWPSPWGRGAGVVEQLVIEEEFAGFELPDYGIGAWIIPTLLQHGTKEQIERWIAPSVRLELNWCQMFSEPGAGSDAAAVQTRAISVEGGWSVSGQKLWISRAQHCNRGLTTVRTDPNAEKHAGISMMVIDLEASGVEIRPLREATGAYQFNEIFLTDVFVPEQNVVGGLGNGWRVARSTLGNERITVGGADNFGGGTVDLLNIIRRLGTSAPNHVLALVGDVLAESQSLTLLRFRYAEKAVGGRSTGLEGNVTKLVRGEHIQRCADVALDLVGASSLFTTGPDRDVARSIVQSRMTTIGGGTSEITRNQIAELILGLPRERSVNDRTQGAKR